MNKVQTIKGIFDRELLEVRDIVSEEENCRVTATEWYLDGELVRRDVNANILCGHALTAEKGEV